MGHCLLLAILHRRMLSACDEQRRRALEFSNELASEDLTCMGLGKPSHVFLLSALLVLLRVVGGVLWRVQE